MKSETKAQKAICKVVRDEVEAATPRIYGDVRDEIRTGDLFMFSGDSVVSGWIRDISHSNYSHCGIAAWWKESLMVIQADHDGIEARPVSEKIYGTARKEIDARNMRSEVGGYHGTVDWYRVVWPEVDEERRDALLGAAIDLLGGSFATFGLVKVGFLTLAGAIRGKPDYRVHPNAMFCSQFISTALVDAGWPDPVGDVPNYLTSPEHLLTSGLYELGAPIKTKGGVPKPVVAEASAG